MSSLNQLSEEREGAGEQGSKLERLAMMFQCCCYGNNVMSKPQNLGRDPQITPSNRTHLHQQLQQTENSLVVKQQPSSPSTCRTIARRLYDMVTSADV